MPDEMEYTIQYRLKPDGEWQNVYYNVVYSDKYSVEKDYDKFIDIQNGYLGEQTITTVEEAKAMIANHEEVSKKEYRIGARPVAEWHDALDDESWWK